MRWLCFSFVKHTKGWRSADRND